MKTLNYNKLENINGGGAGEVVAGACAAFRVASWLSWVPGPGQVIAGVNAACLVYAIGAGIYAAAQ